MEVKLLTCDLTVESMHNQDRDFDGLLYSRWRTLALLISFCLIRTAQAKLEANLDVIP